MNYGTLKPFSLHLYQTVLHFLYTSRFFHFHLKFLCYRASIASFVRSYSKKINLSGTLLIFPFIISSLCFFLLLSLLSYKIWLCSWLTAPFSTSLSAHSLLATLCQALALSLSHKLVPHCCYCPSLNILESVCILWLFGALRYI